MDTVPCPTGDKGICTIPDTTVIATEGNISVVSRDEVEDLFPELELDESSLQPFDFDGSHEDLLQAARSDSIGAPEVQPEQELLRPLLELRADAVIVTCSCGHTFVRTA